ncbi:DMT family transporter [Candidatus Saccharibacteria bacterium]|nr:DMT family transporter [Candidatus Saccharibacteria bacterium]
MTWQIFVFGYLVFATASFLLRRTLAQSLSEHNRLINAFFFLGTLYPVGLIIAAFSSPDLSIGWTNFIFTMLGSLAFPLVMVLAFRANRDIDAGHYTILNNIAPIVTIIAATVLLSESLSGLQLLGAIIIILSAFLVTLPNLSGKHRSNSVGVMFALLSVVILGLGIVFERWMLTRIDYGAYLVYGWGAQTLWMVLLAWPERKNLNLIFAKKNFNHVIWYALTNTFKGVFFVSALKVTTNVSLVSAASSFTAVSVVLAAYIFLKEKQWLWLKILSAIIGTIGLIILNI